MLTNTQKQNSLCSLGFSYSPFSLFHTMTIETSSKKPLHNLNNQLKSQFNPFLA